MPFVINKKGLSEYMKKFLFAGEWYYPSGGINDFIMVGTERECLTKYHQNNWDWGQIIDPTTMKQEIDLSFGDDDTIEVRKMVDGKVVEVSLETISLTPYLKRE